MTTSASGSNKLSKIAVPEETGNGTSNPGPNTWAGEIPTPVTKKNACRNRPGTTPG